MRVRRLSPTGDFVFGRSSADYWVNATEGVAQTAVTRLYLFLGDWFLDQSQGTPWRTKVLGKYTGSTRDPVIQGRIAGTPNVIGIQNYTSSVEPNKRTLTVNAQIITAFGPASLVTSFNLANALSSATPYLFTDSGVVLTTEDGTPLVANRSLTGASRAPPPVTPPVPAVPGFSPQYFSPQFVGAT